MVVERLCGVLLYVLVSLIVCNGIYIGKASIKRWLIGASLVFGLLGYLYIPGANADLTRLLEYMHHYASMSPSDVIEFASHTSTPVYILYFWLIGQFGNDALLPGITTLFGHLLILSCYWDYAEIKGCDREYVAWGIGLFLVSGAFIDLASGIRNELAFAIVFRLI